MGMCLSECVCMYMYMGKTLLLKSKKHEMDLKLSQATYGTNGQKFSFNVTRSFLK